MSGPSTPLYLSLFSSNNVDIPTGEHEAAHTHTLGSVAYTNADGEKKQENREKWNRFNYTERES